MSALWRCDCVCKSPMCAPMRERWELRAIASSLMWMRHCAIGCGRVIVGDAWIIKIGGSLASCRLLTAWLTASCTAARVRPVVIVAGGGVFARAFQPLQQTHAISMEDSHHLAIAATELYGQFLTVLNPIIKKARNKDEMMQAAVEKRPALLLPSELLRQHPMPPHWQVTSDSIAALCARYVEAAALFFVKARAAPVGRVSLAQLQSDELLDRGVSLYAPSVCSWMCLCVDDVNHCSALATGDGQEAASVASVIDTDHYLEWQEMNDG